MVEMSFWRAALPLGFLTLVLLNDRWRLRALGASEEAVWRARRSVVTLTALLSFGAVWASIHFERGTDYVIPLLFLGTFALLAMIGFSGPIARLAGASRRAKPTSAAR